MNTMTDVSEGMGSAGATDVAVRVADLVTVDLTALLLPPVTFAIWRIQVRRERRDRTVEMFRAYESETMKHDRHDAWQYLCGATGPIVPLDRLMHDPDPERLNAYGASYGVLTFFSTIHRLLATRHLDPRLVDELFESSRRSWAEGFASAGLVAEDHIVTRDPLVLLGRSFEETLRRSRWWRARRRWWSEDADGAAAGRTAGSRSPGSAGPPVPPE
jgi:hypothetical protein